MSSPVAVPIAAKQQKTLLGFLFFGFFLTGVATVIVGPILPTFIRRWSLNDSQAGLFFTVQFIASFTGTTLGSFLARRGYRLPLVSGYASLALGFALLNAASEPVATAAIALLGFGYGLVVPGTNLLVAEASGPRRASTLNLLNSAWGVGAVLCSPLVLFALERKALNLIFLCWAVLNFLLALAFALASFGEREQADAAAADPLAVKDAGWALPGIVAFMFLVYVGTETAVGGWSAEHAKRLAGATVLGTIAPMFFYAGLTVGRGLAPLLLRRLRERTVVLLSLCLVMLGTLLTIVSKNLPSALTSVAIAGFGCSTIYPTYIAWFSRWFGARAKALSILMFSSAAVGGAVMPWVVGAVSERMGSLRIGLLVPLAGAAVMIAVVLVLKAAKSQPETNP
jgi:MFS transporter, FHS family, glucose/mannose:H+ symporter